MKAYTAISLAAVLFPSATALESMLGDQTATDASSSQHSRKLGRKGQEYYESIWYRCCNTGQGPGVSKDNPDWRRTDAPSAYDDMFCKCPVRGSENKSWFGWGKTYYEKWEDKCACDGYIAKRANISC